MSSENDCEKKNERKRRGGVMSKPVRAGCSRQRHADEHPPARCVDFISRGTDGRNLSSGLSEPTGVGRGSAGLRRSVSIPPAAGRQRQTKSDAACQWLMAQRCTVVKACTSRLCHYVNKPRRPTLPPTRDLHLPPLPAFADGHQVMSDFHSLEDWTSLR